MFRRDVFATVTLSLLFIVCMYMRFVANMHLTQYDVMIVKGSSLFMNLRSSVSIICVLFCVALAFSLFLSLLSTSPKMVMITIPVMKAKAIVVNTTAIVAVEFSGDTIPAGNHGHYYCTLQHLSIHILPGIL